MRETGVYRLLGEMNYFIPHSLPPSAPPLQINHEIMTLYGEASFALGQLGEVCVRLPSPNHFIKAYTIKEALLSSEIEGIHTTLAEVYTQPLEGFIPNKETQLVLNYASALEVALSMLQKEGLPLVTRVILRAHETLMSSGEGARANPGQFRRQSVRVGLLTPPPASEIPVLMAKLEKYINEPSQEHPIIQAGLAHAYFEIVHPFLDGNGRIGRLLIVLMLIHSKNIDLPILYPSYYFKKYHSEYYQRLDRIRTEGDYEGWITFYLKGVRDSARDAYLRVKEIESLEFNHREYIRNQKEFSKMRDNALKVLDFIFSNPITTIARISKHCDKAYNTIQNIIDEFIKAGIMTENIINKRNKIYKFETYIKLLEKDYDLTEHYKP